MHQHLLSETNEILQHENEPREMAQRNNFFIKFLIRNDNDVYYLLTKQLYQGGLSFVSMLSGDT